MPRLVLESLAATVDFEDPNERLKFLLIKLQERKSSPATAAKYLAQFKKLLGLDPKQTMVDLNKLAFRPTTSRYVPITLLDQLYDHVRYTGDLLLEFCFVSGLRAMEVAQFSNRHLDDLTQRLNTTSLILKGGKKQWQILWTDELVDLVDRLAVHFRDELEHYRTTRTEFPLWGLEPLSISVRFRKAFVELTRLKPPLGFGLHNVRYYWATKFSNNLMLAKLKLNHSSIRTTKGYVKLDAQRIDFAKLNETPFYKGLVET